MRKILIFLIVCVLVVMTGLFIANGIERFDISGVKAIYAKDEKLNSTIVDLSKVISVDYNTAESSLKRAANTMVESKTEYENQAALSNLSKSSYASRLEKYDIDYLWTKLGNYAKEENVVIKIEVTSSGAKQDIYDLKFSVNGQYVNITEFIYDIENDSRLGFKIDEFTMIGNDDGLAASFVCTEIPINVGDTIQNIDANSNKEEKEEIKETEEKKTTSDKATNVVSVPNSLSLTSNTNSNS